jgi:hypothetical protein
MTHDLEAGKPQRATKQARGLVPAGLNSVSHFFGRDGYFASTRAASLIWSRR